MDNDKSWIAVLVVIFLLGLLLVMDAEAGEYRIGMMPTSHHWEARANGYNETHDGIIAEFKYNNGWIGYLNMENSFYDESHWVYYLQPISVWKPSKKTTINLGWQFGAVTGYDVSPAPFATITLAVSFGNLRARAAVIPGIVTGYQYLYEFGGE